MKTRTSIKTAFIFCVLISNGLVFSSPSISDMITVQTKDMDNYVNYYWMHLMIKFTNTGKEMIDLKGIEIRYLYTDSKAQLVDLDSGDVYWFNTHSPDWQYNYGSRADVKIFSVVTDASSNPKKATICIRFYNGKLYPNGGEANIEFGVHKTDWSNFYELDDPSYIRSTEYTRNTNVPVKSREYSPPELSDMRIFMRVSPGVLDTDLSPSWPMTDLRKVRELISIDVNDNRIENPLTVADYRNALFEHPFEVYKTVLPEMNYRWVADSSAGVFYIDLHRGDADAEGGSGPPFHINWHTNPNFIALQDAYYNTSFSNQFVDRNQTYVHNVCPFLFMNYNTVAQKINNVTYGFHGYRLRYGGRHEFGHGVGLVHQGSGVNNFAVETESVMHQNDNRSYNDDFVRCLDAAQLSNCRNYSTGTAYSTYLVSYPYIAKFVTMRNNPEDTLTPGVKRFYYTNSYYDVRYRMYETQYIDQVYSHPSRFYIQHLDSVMVSTSADDSYFRGSDPNAYDFPTGLIVDNAGKAGWLGMIYVGVWAQVRTIDNTGLMRVFAGTGELGYANGERLSAQFADHTNPQAIDNSGNIYICENTQHRIRKIDISTDQVSLFAGSDTYPGVSGDINGTGSAARFNAPASLVFDSVNNVIYVADRNNNKIKRITMAGAVTTYISSGINFPTGLAIDNLRRILYVSEWGTNANSIKMVNLNNAAVSTIAGSTDAGFVDGIGTAARFNKISDIDVDEQGNIWVVDVDNHAVRYIMRNVRAGGIDYAVSTIAGNGTAGTNNGSGTYATFNNIVDVSCDMKGNVFVTDQGAVNMRKISWVIPITMNAPRMGNRIDSIYDANYYRFTNNESKRVLIEVDTNLRCNNVNIEVFGPDNDYALVYSEMDGRNARFDNTLAAGRYLVRITTNRTTTQRPGAYSIRVHDGRDLFTAGQQNGNIEFEGDNDWYSFNASPAGSYTIDATNISASLNGQVHLSLYAKNRVYNQNNQERVIPDTLVAQGINTITATLENNRFYWVRARAGHDPENANDFTIGTYNITARRN